MYIVFFQILMHIILEIQKSADNHTFEAKRQVHSRNCGQDNASTIFKWMKIIHNYFFIIIIIIFTTLAHY